MSEMFLVESSGTGITMVSMWSTVAVLEVVAKLTSKHVIDFDDVLL